MKIIRNVKLAPHTSLYVGGKAKYFSLCKNTSDIKQALAFANTRGLKVHVLGGGCNTVFSDSGFDGLVIKIAIKGVNKIKETNQHVFYEVGAGENWDQFVKLSVKNGLYGIENMSYVPGTVGAAAVQNVGCYGQEASETIVSVRLYEISTGKVLTKKTSELGFGYRQSVFNRKDRGKYIILSSTFRLAKKGKINLTYGDVAKYFQKHPTFTPNLSNVRKAIIRIRNSKYPYPKSPTTGTVGSFFKAKPVSGTTFYKIIRTLRKKGFESKAAYIENLRDSFKVKQGYKVPYGLLIDSLGFKGKKIGGAMVLTTHADILNNWNGKAKARDFTILATKIMQTMKQTYGVELVIEPELVGKF